MSKTGQIEVKKLCLDLHNFRTMPQKSENDAINAMLSIKPDRFYAVMESIIKDNYLPTENIIVIEDTKALIVKEGNRRIAALKLIHGFIDADDFDIPISIKNKIKKIDSSWKRNNRRVPCTIFTKEDIDKVNKIINLAHGKGEKASRDSWNSVARARHNRDVNHAVEPALDLLEKYLLMGKNLTEQQKERWSGDYNLTVLEEAIRKIVLRLEIKNIIELSQQYPTLKFRSHLEDIMRDIGMGLLGFKEIRKENDDFGTYYEIPLLKEPEVLQKEKNIEENTKNNSEQSQNINNKCKSKCSSINLNKNETGSSSQCSVSETKSTPKKAYAINDTRQVSNLLKKFCPRGENRAKIVTLRNEMKELKIPKNPMAFCFLLRSIFEISAKIYSEEHGISLINKKEHPKTLGELLKDITNDLTANNTKKDVVKLLHGAMTEIDKPHGLLSVTSMNQLVHNPSFSIQSSDISILFGNVFPLLEYMN